MRALVALAAGTVLLSLAALACTGGDDAARARLEAPCTNNATVEAFTPVGVDERTPGVPNVQPDDERLCRLRRGLLTADDLPGWRFDTSLRSGDDRLPFPSSPLTSHFFGCNTTLPGYHDGLRYFFELDVDGDRDDDDLLNLRHLVFAVPTGSGEAYMRASRMHCEDKRDRTDRDDEWARIDVPAVAEDREGWQLTTGHGSSQRIVWVRDGDVISVVSLAAIGDLDRVDLDAIVRLAADKLALVGPLPEAPSLFESCEGNRTPRPSVPTEALEKALLRDEDLRGGWFELVSDGCGIRDSDAFCEPVEGEPPVRPLAHVTSSLVHGERGAVAHQARLYSEGDARDMIQWLRETYGGSASCAAMSNNETLTWRLSPLDFEILVGETVAYRLSTRIEQQDLAYTYVWWRRGDAIATVVYRESPGWPELPIIVYLADAKFAAAADEINALPR